MIREGREGAQRFFLFFFAPFATLDLTGFGL